MALDMIDGHETKLALERIGAGDPQALCADCGETAALARVSFPYTRIDLRGQGQSKIDPASIPHMSLDDYMADLDATMAHLKAQSVPFIAYSQAAFFITHYAVMNPDAVSKLVLIEPALFTKREELLKRAEIAERGNADGAVGAMLKYVQPSLGLNVRTSASVRKSIVTAAQSPEFIAASFRIRANHPITKRHLRSLKMPVLLIGGTKSHVKDMVTRAAALIPGSAVWWVPNAQHLDIMSQQYAPKMGPVVESFLS